MDPTTKARIDLASLRGAALKSHEDRLAREAEGKSRKRMKAEGREVVARLKDEKRPLKIYPVCV